MSDDIIGRIGDVVDPEVEDLIDSQLQHGEHSGFEEMCPHCGRHWHGLPLTKRIHEMYMKGVMDPDYRIDTDDSPVLCKGSDFIGPMPYSEDNDPWMSISAFARVRAQVEDDFSQMARAIQAEMAAAEVASWERMRRGCRNVSIAISVALWANVLVIINDLFLNRLTPLSVINVACVLLLTAQWRQNRNRRKRLDNDRPDGASSPSRWPRWLWRSWGRLVVRHRKGGPD